MWILRRHSSVHNRLDTPGTGRWEMGNWTLCWWPVFRGWCRSLSSQRSPGSDPGRVVVGAESCPCVPLLACLSVCLVTPVLVSVYLCNPHCNSEGGIVIVTPFYRMGSRGIGRSVTGPRWSALRRGPEDQLGNSWWPSPQPPCTFPHTYWSVCPGLRVSRVQAPALVTLVATFEACLGIQINIPWPQVSLSVMSLNIRRLTDTEVSLHFWRIGYLPICLLVKITCTLKWVPVGFSRSFPDICRTAKIWVPDVYVPSGVDRPHPGF